MPNLKKQHVLPSHRKMILLTVTRVETTAKDNRKERKIKLVWLITNQLLSLILSRLRLILPHLVVVVDTMEVDEAGEVEGT